MLKKNNPLMVVFLAGLFLQILLLFVNYSGDVPNHIVWAKDAVNLGMPGLYEREFAHRYGNIAPNYPSLSIFLFTILYLLHNWVLGISWFLNIHIKIFPSQLIPFLESNIVLPYLFKIPAVISNLGIAYISYLLIKKLIKNKKLSLPLTVSSLALFNPAYFYIGSVWGQVDTIPLFFILLSFYYLIFKKKYLTSAVLFTSALLFKQISFIFLPFFILVLLKKIGLKKLQFIFLFCSGLFWLSFLPFYQRGSIIFFPFITYFEKILMKSGIPYTSNHAFNLWYLLTGSLKIQASTKWIFGLSFETWGFIMFGIILFSILYALNRKFTIERIFYAGFLIPFAGFLFLTKMHERHLVMVLPFLLLLGYKNSYYLRLFLFVSFFNFLNMYHNWWAPPLPFVQNILSLWPVTASLTVFLIFIFSIEYIRFFSVFSRSHLSDHSSNKDASLV